MRRQRLEAGLGRAWHAVGAVLLGAALAIVASYVISMET
jgi:hypothetical protein